MRWERSNLRLGMNAGGRFRVRGRASLRYRKQHLVSIMLGNVIWVSNILGSHTTSSYPHPSLGLGLGLVSPYIRQPHRGKQYIREQRQGKQCIRERRTGKQHVRQQRLYCLYRHYATVALHKPQLTLTLSPRASAMTSLGLNL